MNLEIHNPELVQRVNALIRTGHFHDADDLIELALDALTLSQSVTAAADEKLPATTSATERHQTAGRKSLVEVFAPLRGLNLDFSRNKSCSL